VPDGADPAPGETPAQLLERASAGDAQAASRLLPLVYDELRRLAAGYLRRERKGQTLQATALVHEAYVRLIGPAERAWGLQSGRGPAARISSRSQPARCGLCCSIERAAAPPPSGVEIQSG
jgi:hypothetical protein